MEHKKMRVRQLERRSDWTAIGTAALIAAIATLAAGAGPARAAKPYPTNVCVGSKLAAASKLCKKSLIAWSQWEKRQDDAKRDAAIAKATTVFQTQWSKADDKALKKGVDCADTTVDAASLQGEVDSRVQALVAQINSGLDLLGDKQDAKCGSKLLKAAAVACDKLVVAESKYVKLIHKDPAGDKRSQLRDVAQTKFSSSWQKFDTATCSTDATEGAVAASLEDLAGQLYADTTISPNVNDAQFSLYSPTGPIAYLKTTLDPTCIGGTPYHYFVKRGTVNKVLYYFQGGGACWESLTCGIPVCKNTVDPVGDDPTGASTGFADLSNPSNPFKDWHIVYVPYCSCDIHFGDSAQPYTTPGPNPPGGSVPAQHRGYQNAKVVEKFAREHFVMPEEIFVTGSSAGAYGALFHGPLLHEVWPGAQVHVLADAGNGVITPEFLTNEFENWNFRGNLPDDIPGVVESIDEGTGMVGYIDAVASAFPNTTWAHYSSAFDGGGGGQTGFYNVMLNNNNPIAALTWWEGSCAFNSVMRQQVQSSALDAPSNYRYYIGSGSRHTMWGSDKVYSDTLGGVPTIASWVSAMLASRPPAAVDPSWTNVEAVPFNVLLPGDVQPPTLPTPPFEQSGADVVVNCP